MVRNSNSERLRYRYGICLKEDCTKCKSKEVQQISARKEFVCEECGKSLRECPPPRSWWQMHGKQVTALSVAAVLILGGAGAYFAFSGDDSKPEKVVSTETEQVAVTETEEPSVVEETETAVEEKTIAVELEKVVEEATTTQSTVAASKTNGKLQLSYGAYTGDLKNGYPHGQGRLTYTTDRQINRYDMKKRMAKAGQYVIGEFERGFFIQGRLYAADGELIESIMIGTAPGNTYDAK